MEWPHLYDGAGKSALREHRRLARAWRRRRFGGWMRLVYPSIFVLMVLATFLSGVWKTTGWRS